MDAVPITFGQILGAYFSALENILNQNTAVIELLCQLSLGGTAIGTGLNSDPRYSKKIVEKLREYTGYNLTHANDLVEKTQFMNDFKAYTDYLTNIAIVLNKICEDLMLLSSGPFTGLNEINLPRVEPGSSIMPGKINPSILESVNMVCFQVMGNSRTVEQACSSGKLELNVYTPVIAYNIFTSITLLTRAVDNLRKRCIDGITVNMRQAEHNFIYSNAVATLLAPLIGFKEASKLASEAREEGKPIMEYAIDNGIISSEEAGALLRNSTEPNMEMVKGLIEERKRGESEGRIR